MSGRYSSFGLVLVIVAALVLAAVWAARPQPVKPSSSPAGPGPLKVINGSRMYTNVAGGSLQQAAAPSGSATSSDLSPQQASPNYCAPGEVPYADGCVPR